MSNTLQEMTQDMQARIRELAYLMWESAGRQQGMAIEYWLKAEGEVLTTLQQAATRMMPSPPAAKPAAEKPAVAAPPPAVEAPKPAAAPPPRVATPEPAAASAARKPAARSKSKV